MKIVESWLEENPLSAHHIRSYLEWQHFGLLKTLRAQKIVSKTKTWQILDAVLSKPELSPQDCVERNLTYESRLLVTFSETRLDGQTTMIPGFELARIPMIVMPDECDDGIGGFFVIKGTERVLITQLRTAYNQPICSLNRPDLKKNRVRAEQNGHARQDTTVAELKVRSISEASGHSCQSDLFLTRLDQLLLECKPKFKGRVNVGLALKSLGCCELEDFAWATGCKETAHLLWLGSLTAHDQASAIEQLDAQLGADSRRLLLTEVWPHLGLESSPAGCCRYIGSLAERLVRAKREQQGDNRDALRFKRFEAAGHLLSELFEQIYKRWVSQVQKWCHDKDNLIVGIHGTEFITKRILYCFSTGTWGSPFGKFLRLGVSQARCNLSQLSRLSHLLRCSNPQSRETKNLLVRQLDPSELGYVCPLDSPEGAKIGIVKNMTFATCITRHTVGAHVLDALQCNDSSMLQEIQFGAPGLTVSVNGKPVYLCSQAERLVKSFVELRRLGYFDHGCSIGQDEKNLMIWTDAGRIIRPVWTRSACCKDLRSCHWPTELAAGRAQWIDPFESEFCGRFSEEQELNEALMFGLSAATIPLLGFQPSVRGVFGAAMIKQAVSLLGPGQHDRLDTTAHVSNRVEKPLVATKCQALFGLDRYPLGVNLLVAVAPLAGYNQEDAVVLNQHSVDRGLFNGQLLKTHQAEEYCDGNVLCRVELPELSARLSHVNYCLLGKDGLPELGAEMQQGDAIIGLTTRSYGKSRCSSVVCSKGEEGVVVRIVKSIHEDFLVVKIVLQRELRIMNGDKLSSRYSQKGISGKIVHPSELPFCADGTVPDMVINALCLPSRMTLPTIIEGQLGNRCVATCSQIELDAFQPHYTIEKIQDSLEELGLDRFSEATMFCPETLGVVEVAEPNLPVSQPPVRRVMLGVMYYLWLAHFAEPKCYARDTGVRSKLKRQPTDGRSRLGGLKFGEMDRDACITMPAVLDDRLFWSSDAFWVPVCSLCHQIAVNRFKCLCGGKSEQIKTAKLAFTNHMVFNLMRAAGCWLRFHVEKDGLVKVTPRFEGGEEEFESETDDDAESCSESEDENAESDSEAGAVAGFDELFDDAEQELE